MRILYQLSYCSKFYEQMGLEPHDNLLRFQILLRSDSLSISIILMFSVLNITNFFQICQIF